MKTTGISTISRSSLYPRSRHCETKTSKPCAWACSALLIVSCATKCKCVLVRAAPGRALLLLEGARSVLSEPGVRRESLQGAVITLSVVLGLPILRARDAAETARMLRYTVEQVRRAGSNTLRRAGYRPRRLRARQLFILQGLPGIGPERAARLLDMCGSVAGVFAAKEEVLQQVPGIGKRTAAAIYQLAHASAIDQAPAPFGPVT